MLLLTAALALQNGFDYPPNAVPRLAGITVPGLPPVDGHLHVDQFGYRPSGQKVCVVSDPQTGYNAKDRYSPGTTLQVRDDAGKVVLTGAPIPWKNGATDEASGDRGWWFDFSALKTPGRYHVFDPTNGVRSPRFRVGDDVYAPVLRAATRAFYHQRLGVALPSKHAGKWAMATALRQDREARSVHAKDDPASARNLVGGWMDAGDTNKYPPFNADVISPLLYAYRRSPAAFGDADGIPESGNGLPDLLDELKEQLDWMVRMQEPDGGVWVKMGNVDYNGVQPLANDRRPRYYGPKDTGATITTCAALAHAARVYGAFPAWRTYAANLRNRAVKAWRYYQANPKTTNSDTGEIKSGNANKSLEEQRQLEAYAAIQLLGLTRDARTYGPFVRQRVGETRQLAEWLWSPYNSGIGEGLCDYLSMPGADPEIAAKIRAALVRSAASDDWNAPMDRDLYRAWMVPTSYHWGSNFVRAAYGTIAMLAAEHGGVDAATKARLRARAAGMLNSFHGVNPLAMTYLTNMRPLGAELSAMRLYHERYGIATPFRAEPPPGYVVGGPNRSFSGKSERAPGSIEWIKTQPPGKAYGDFNDAWPESSWELTENSNTYQAMYVRLAAEFVGR